MNKRHLLFAYLAGSFAILGMATTVALNPASPVKAAGTSIEKTVFLSAGNTHSFALTSTGNVYAWGDNAYGQLGDGTTIGKTSPIRLPSSSFGDEAVTSILSGNLFSMALTSSGKVYTWGKNESGQLGDGTNIDKSVPTLIPPSAFGGESVESFSSGGAFAVALTSTHKVYSWGNNVSGQLGDGTNVSKNVPNRVFVSGFDDTAAYEVATISAGDSHCLLYTRVFGKIYVWGLNSNGQLGLGNTASFNSPQFVSSESFPSSTPSFISTGSSSSYALTPAASGKVFSWGNNASGQLGVGSTSRKTAPASINQTKFASKPVTSLFSGSSHCFALNSAGTLYSWGKNDASQLGDGTTANQTNPVAISSTNFGEEQISMVSPGISSYSLALTSSGSVYAWGNNASGKLGDGTTVNQSSPERIVSLSTENFFASKLSEYNTCSDYGAAYSALSSDYEALSSAQRASLATIVLNDYSSVDDYSTGAKGATVFAADKWARIVALYNATHPSGAVSFSHDDGSQVSAVLVAMLAVGALGCASFYAIKKRRGQQ